MNNISRFIKDSQGIIKDKQTGLQWYSGPHDLDWYETQAWVQGLSVGGGGWRMPIMRELEGLHCSGETTLPLKNKVFLIDPIFNLQEPYIWSGEEGRHVESAECFCFSDTVSSWELEMSFDRDDSYSAHPLAVRSISYLSVDVLSAPEPLADSLPRPSTPQKPSSVTSASGGDSTRFTKDSQDVITDDKTNLQWYVGADELTWSQAQAWVQSLSVGRGGWRLPTMGELKALYGSGETTYWDNITWYIDKIFGLWSDRVWSVEVRVPAAAWYINYLDGSEKWMHQDTGRDFVTFAVRSNNLPSDEVFSGQAPLSKSALDIPVILQNPVPEVSASANGRFIRDDLGIILDRKTGMEWYVGPDQDTTLGQAQSWAQSLSVGGGGWRMPKRDKLIALHGTGQTLSPQGNYYYHIAPIFDLRRSWVWAERAWCFGFAGDEGWFDPHGSHNYRAFAVRFRSSGIPSKQCSIQNNSQPRPFTPLKLSSVTSASGGDSARFTKDSLGVITDRATGLQWYVGRNRDTSEWKAEVWMKNLTVGGGGWGMPTRAELSTLNGSGETPSPQGYYTLRIDPIFNLTGDWVWTGECFGRGASWTFLFNLGEESWFNTHLGDYGRAFAVRPIASEESDQGDGSGRFFKDSQGVITDQQTGLQWHVAPWDAQSLDQAETEDQELPVDDSGWRSPTIEELSGLYGSGVTPAPEKDCDYYIAPIFNLTSRLVPLGDWHFDFSRLLGHEESVQRYRVRGGVKFFDFSCGEEDCKNVVPDEKLCALVVRSGSQQGGDSGDGGRFVLDSLGITKDRQTGLQWYAGPDQDMTWSQAQSWVKSLSVGGGGWRLPTVLKLKILYESAESASSSEESIWPVDQIFGPKFSNKKIHVWSGSTKASRALILSWCGMESIPPREYARDMRAFAVRGRW